MRVSRAKLDIALARRCLSMRNFLGTVSTSTLTRISKGECVAPKTIGKLAKALGVDVTEIMEEE